MNPDAKVSRISPALLALTAPAPLRDIPAWLTWRYESFEDEPKPRKVPYYADGARRSGRQGSPEDRARLTTFALACEQAAKRGMSGVGFAPLQGLGVVALDFDNCVEDGIVDAGVEAVIAGTYCEYSPSGRGVRAFFSGSIGNRKAATTPNDYGLETFSTSGFVTVTGHLLPHVDVLGLEDALAPVNAALVDLCERRFKAAAPALTDDFTAGYEPKLGLTLDEIEDLVDQLDPDIGRDEWIRVGMALHHELEGDGEGFAIWDAWSSGGAKYPGEHSLQTQWDSFTRRVGPGQRQVTMASVKKMVADSQRVAQADKLREAHDTAVSSFDGKFPAVPLSAMVGQPLPRWLIKGVLPQTEDPIILFGASGAGKSFVAIDMACAIARGTAWRDRRVAKGKVLYLAAEGGAGIAKRFRAYCLHHKIDMADLQIDVITACPNILESDDVKEIVKSMGAFGPYTAVFIDTLAQVTPGANENSGEDMGRVLANIKAVQQVTHATVVAIHHAGKDLSKGSRGWSGLKAGVEAQIEVVRDEASGGRHIRIEKMKDGEDGLRFGFKLEVHALAMDEDGDEVTSCAVVEDELRKPETREPRATERRRGRFQTHVLDMVSLLDSALATMPLSELVKFCADALPKPDVGIRDTRRQDIHRAIQGLGKEKDGPLQVRDNLVIFYS